MSAQVHPLVRIDLIDAAEARLAAARAMLEMAETAASTAERDLAAAQAADAALRRRAAAGELIADAEIDNTGGFESQLGRRVEFRKQAAAQLRAPVQAALDDLADAKVRAHEPLLRAAVEGRCRAAALADRFRGGVGRSGASEEIAEAREVWDAATQQLDAVLAGCGVLAGFGISTWPTTEAYERKAWATVLSDPLGYMQRRRSARRAA